MKMQINCTQDGVVSYPLHKHNSYEIMYYIKGEGVMRTENGNFPFAPGTIIIVPPGTVHGSTSKEGFKNISVSDEFQNLFHFTNTVVLYDNQQQEGKILATLIYNNRHKNSDYLLKLVSSYIHFILENISLENNIGIAVNKIINEITDTFYNSEINLADILKKSGYAEDYIRAQFKKITGKTPNEFLTGIRIKRAVFLIDIYSDTLSLQQIAYRCGYTDYIYFSKKFKALTDISPQKYKLTKNKD